MPKHNRIGGIHARAPGCMCSALIISARCSDHGCLRRFVVGERSLRFSPDGLVACDRTWDVQAEGAWTIGQLKAHLKEEHELEGKKIRLISLGRMLADPTTLVLDP